MARDAAVKSLPWPLIHKLRKNIASFMSGIPLVDRYQLER